MANLLGYNEDDVQISDFEPLPNGDYKVEIIDSEEKESKNGHMYISLDMVVRGGQYDGRHIFENLNVGHPNETVVNIAHQTIKKISLALGKSGVKDSSDLHGKPFMVNILNKLNKKGEPTEYRKFSPLEGESTNPVSTQSSDEKAPWSQ